MELWDSNVDEIHPEEIFRSFTALLVKPGILAFRKVYEDAKRKLVLTSLALGC